MDRRESLKLIAWSTVSTSLILDACKTKDREGSTAAAAENPASAVDRMAEEKEVYEKLTSYTFFQRA